MSVSISVVSNISPASASVEVVERKGLGHPDSICDALAEAVSVSLCKYYFENFGFILHHNVDKALLLGGSSRSQFNGGHVVSPMEFFLAGRATQEFRGKRIPVEELVLETCRQWLQQHLHAIDTEHHVKLHSMVRPGSTDLVDLFLRQQQTGVALANDTSCGVGYAPLDELEQVVLAIEKQLNEPSIKAVHPEIGEDIKVMAVRREEHIDITLSCAFVDRYITDVEDYMQKKSRVADMAATLASSMTGKPVEVSVNTADSANANSLFLTVTGTSAESGDDGEVGRGNRVNGLITPYRPMNMEAVAGKNPVTHVGKLYNITAQLIAAAIVEDIVEVSAAECYLVSQIGRPVADPQLVDIRVQVQDDSHLDQFSTTIKDIVHQQLQHTGNIQKDIISGP